MTNVLPTSPMSLACPFCKAQPGSACETTAGGRLEVVHVARIKAAEARDFVRNKQKPPSLLARANGQER